MNHNTIVINSLPLGFEMPKDKYLTCALYKFATLSKYQEMREPLWKKMKSCNVFGTILLANEGINGTISGNSEDVISVVDWLEDNEDIGKLEIKRSYSDEIPFYRTKVKLKKEIVTMGIEDLDPSKSAGQYVEPEEWNKLISNPNVLIIDTRNEYEVSIGTFVNSVNPGLSSFRDFPGWATDNLSKDKNKKIAMFCTGGIRCEKSTALLRERGFDEVYHLKGGILNYLAEVPEKDSLWRGECFVFDNRVAVDHDLNKGSYDQCHACRRPITEDNKKSQRYVRGVSCEFCFSEVTDQRKLQFAERQKQIDLAKGRGEQHIGQDVSKVNYERRLKKQSSMFQGE